MTIQDARLTDRVTVSVPIEVNGSDATGQVFFERTITLVVSRSGATVVLERKLFPEQELMVRNLQNQKEAEMRVVGAVARHAKGDVYGLIFVDSRQSIWDIDFPSRKDSPEAAFRLLMECSRCKAQQVAYLNELESEVFQASGALQRRCDACRDSTIWKQSTGPAPAQAPASPSGSMFDPNRPIPDAAPKQTQADVDEEESLAPRPPRTVNDRKHVRSKMQIEVCVRPVSTGGAPVHEDVEMTEDCSRGGFSFYTATRYKKDERVEVAMPYRKGTANIFVPARIANVRKQKDGRYRYGVAYIRTFK